MNWWTPIPLYVPQSCFPSLKPYFQPRQETWEENRSFPNAFIPLSSILKPRRRNGALDLRSGKLETSSSALSNFTTWMNYFQDQWEWAATSYLRQLLMTAYLVLQNSLPRWCSIVLTGAFIISSASLDFFKKCFCFREFRPWCNKNNDFKERSAHRWPAHIRMIRVQHSFRINLLERQC